MTVYSAIIMTIWAVIVSAIVSLTVLVVAIVIRDIRELEEPDEHADIDRHWLDGQRFRRRDNKPDRWADAVETEARAMGKPGHWAEGADGRQFDE